MEVNEEEAAEQPSVEPLDVPCAACALKQCSWCASCHGTGYVLTERGKALIEFLERHLDVRTDPWGHAYVDIR